MKQSELLIQALENHPENQQLAAIELIISKQTNLQELCALSAPSMNEEQLPPLLVVYEMRSLILQVSSEDSQKIQSYLSSKLEDLHNKVSPEAIIEIEGENLVNFLSQTSDYLFEKVGDSLSALSTTIQERVNHAVKARSDPHINQSICEQAINTTIDSVFKAAVSGVMSGSLETGINQTIQESANRVMLGGAGLALSSALETQIDQKRKKSLVKAGAKTLGKTGSLLGASVAALGGAAVASLPKYSADVVMHGVIGGVSGYVKTGTVTGAIESAVKSATSRGIYSYGWEFANGKTSLNNTSFVEAGAARIGSKMIADGVVNMFPMAGAAAVAGAVIVENISDYIKDSKNPYVLSAVETIQNSLPYLRDTAKNIWNAVDEFSMEIYGVDAQEFNTNKDQESKTSVAQTKDPDSTQVKSSRIMIEVEPKNRSDSFDSLISEPELREMRQSFHRQDSESPKSVARRLSPPPLEKRKKFKAL